MARIRHFGIVAGVVALATVLALAAAAQPAPPSGPDIPRPWRNDGQTVWIDIPAGRLKTRVYPSADLGERPVLVVYVHGDIPIPREDQEAIPHAIARASRNVVAVGVLRPGYKDVEGEASSGQMNFAIGDNYTPEVVDAVDAAIRQLRSKFHAGAVILVGHSGGGAISADLLGRHPEDVQGAVLAACGCDPQEFMTRWVAEHPRFPRNLPNPSLLPLALAPKVSLKAHVRMLIGSEDDVVRRPSSEAYVAALKARGIDVQFVVIPGVGHNDILRRQPVYDVLAELIAMEGGRMVSPPQLPSARPSP